MTSSKINFRDLNSTTGTIINENKPLLPQNSDQFKATKMWNEVLHAFYLGIELKKHRRQMKSYYDCFTASEGITWLKNYLKKNSRFSENKITRFQALNLLRKYHKSNIIERINFDKNDLELKDNNELFRFSVDANESLPFLTTSKSEADLLKSCSVLEDFKPVELDVREKIDIYKRAIWSHLNRSLYNISDYVKFEQIDGQVLLNNVTRVNSNGVVQLTDKNEDLPHWILSAMKCLANWPKASGSGNCLPKYPGFEYDVFKLIREYFTNMEEPLIPFNFYILFIDVHELYVKALLSEKRKKFNTSALSIISSKLLNNHENLKHISQELGLPANCVYETVFSSKEPVTKIVPIDELSNVFPSLLEYFKQQHTNNLNESTLLTNQHRLNVKTVQQPLSPTASSNSVKAPSTIPRKCPSRKKLSAMNESDSTLKCSTTLNLNISTKENFDEKKPSFESIPENGLSYNDPSIETSFDMSLKNQYYELFQLLLLLLPTANRRHLQLLIRLFYKIIRNKELCLLTKDALALKEHIVNIFTRCIICSGQEKDFNEFKSKEFVSFLIDECMEIFKVPESFRNEVDKIMTDLRNKMARGNGTNDYCQKISNEEYELQRDALSDVALSDLLQSIMKDSSLTERDKLKWIKQFKMYHPDVYDIYFTKCNNQIEQKHRIRSKQQRACSLESQTTSNIKQKRDLFKRFLSLKL